MGRGLQRSTKTLEAEKAAELAAAAREAREEMGRQLAAVRAQAEESKEEAPAEPEVRRSPGASRAAPAGRLCDSVVLRPLRYQWFGLLCPRRRHLLRSWSGSPQSACCDPPCGLR